ncbi:hypothetical protein AB1Y20_014525 [Prymnesium parvum]|uniref:cellulose 1,4-beta-cellobiosidase (non-reducing end) n=1 Tax=Prymnesium parvum TaxID=97485 RepID=A0AB34IB17_PRYPA
MAADGAYTLFAETHAPPTPTQPATRPRRSLILAAALSACVLLSLRRPRRVEPPPPQLQTSAANLLTLRVDGVDAAYEVLGLNSTPSPRFRAAARTLQLQRGATAPTEGTRLWLGLGGGGGGGALRYARFRLLGRRLRYTIDLSAVGCSCNAALYWVSMPGVGPAGAPARGGLGNFYCDANEVGGVWCWEMDTIEANRHAMQVAPHACASPPGRYIAACDRGGAALNTRSLSARGLCAAKSCTIDTRHPFTHVQSFVQRESTLVRIENELRQGEKVFAFNSSASQEYLAQMSEALRDGMTLTFQVWGGPWSLMSWLDIMSGCLGDCPESAHVTYTDISIESM